MGYCREVDVTTLSFGVDFDTLLCLRVEQFDTAIILEDGGNLLAGI